MLYRCDANGAEAGGETCMNEALCQVGIAAGACGECSPGTFRCDGAVLAKCSDTGRFEPWETCASASLCKESAGACTEMVCMPNATTCAANGTLQTCNSDGSALADMESCGMGLCDAVNRRCNECVPNARSCNGNTAVTCSSDGQRTTSTPCEASNDCTTASCSGGQCRTSMKPSGSRCSSDGGRVCDGSGRCVPCVKDDDCPGQFEACTDRRCMPGPGCGNGVVDPGEHCEITGPDAYQRGCDQRTCTITDAAYAVCAQDGMPSDYCPFNRSQDWFCGVGGLCTHVCTRDVPGQCGTGTCVEVPEPNGRLQGYCFRLCSGTGAGGCPAGSLCQDFSAVPGFPRFICGTYDGNP